MCIASWYEFCPTLASHLFSLLQHSSFERPYKVKNVPPFEIAGSGWGYFTISIIIALKEGYSWVSSRATVGQGGLSLLPFTWTLNFERQLTYQDFGVDVAIS